MFRHGRLLRCSSTTAAPAHTLTAWLSRLAQQADALPPQPNTESGLTSSNNSTTSATTSNTSAASSAAQELFRELAEASSHANALRETDTVFAILHSVLKKQYFPSDVEAWARLATQLLPYGGVEASCVLHYPGRSAATAKHNDGPASASDDQSRFINSGSQSYNVAASSSVLQASAAHVPRYALPITRETLLMTGGVVPLSARLPCGDGRIVALFLDNFAHYIRTVQRAPASSEVTEAASTASSLPLRLSPEIVKAVQAMSRTVLQALRINAPTLQWELLMPSLLNYLQLLHELDLQSRVNALHAARGQGETETADTEVMDDEAQEEGEEDDGTERLDLQGAAMSSQQTHFLQRMLKGLSHDALAYGAHGARVSLYYLNDYFARVVEQFQASDAVRQLPDAEATRLYWREQRYLISLTRGCMRAIYLYYTPDSATAARAARRLSLTTDLVLAAPMNGTIEALYDQIDVIFQENTNAQDPLQLQPTAAAKLKDIHTLALLRALRVEEAAPDTYLRRALEVVDRVPASMAIEGELIAGKVRLLDLDSDTVDEDGRTAVYNDLLTSLRSLVEMRPRFTRQDRRDEEESGGGSGEGDGESRRESVSEDVGATSQLGEEGGEDGDNASVHVDAVTQSILQRAHIDVLTAFCAAHKEEWLNEAYNILVTHKYHGLKITKEVILPVLEVFSRRGDCRAFNLVDLCVLYSNEPIDMQTIALLFRTCEVAGDHYRARTFLQLLNEIIPGFLVKCPPAVRESLQELKLLDRPPRHLFVSAEDDLVQSALGEDTPGVRRLPNASPL